jgi:NADH-ubiquinone oxidoreductase chain 4
MLIYLLVLLPLLGIIFLSSINHNKINNIKTFSLFIAILNLCVSLLIYILFDNSNVDYQFIQEITEINGLNIYIGIDGISIYFILLTTFITPIVILSN